MKTIRLIAAAIMLAAVVAISASAQTRPGAATPKPAAPQTLAAPAPTGPIPDSKIAYIDTGAFGEDKGGITRLVTAMNALEREFKPRQDELNNINARLKTIADEISKLSGNSVVDPKTIQAKQDEGEKLQRELKYKKEQADADFAKRYKEVIDPISADIFKALNQFAGQRGITMILDISKLAPNGVVLTANPNMDVTQAFITEFNAKPATASAAAPK
jgi:Skp family chaperone for outer membrane proteins